MRKHDVRKWLHAILDLLPVILIPVFMIYSHRHDINDGSIQVQEKIAVDFNQLIPIPNVDISKNENNVHIIDNRDGSFNVSTDGLSSGVTYVAYSYFQAIQNHVYVVRGTPSNIDNRGRCYVSSLINSDFDINGNGVRGVQANTTRVYPVFVYIYGNVQIDDPITFTLNVFDLTQMFGSGNEPTLSVFNELFPNRYYDYTLSKKMLIDGDLITYDDTDIMSQFTYQLYNSVDKYFNVGNVFHLGEVYDWFNLNIFNGSAPLYIYVVYQIVLYELVMDLLFLLYALFMWFIDMIQKLMEKPLNSIK